MRRGRRRPDDSGTSLAELMVTMGIMSVVMVLFTGAILQVYKTVSATDTRSDAQNQLARAFQRFDQQLRYASWIGDPAKATSGTWYVGFAGVDPTDCYQLRLVPGDSGKPGVLQLFSWKAGLPPASGTVGQTLASQIDMTDTPANPFKPFTKHAYGATPFATATPTPGATPIGGKFESKFQMLRIQLTARTGAGLARIDATFTALNTGKDTPDSPACNEGKPS
ncbi:type II secretion system protein J [Actinoplanes sp. NPDC049681]|uniref:type II secretion system protein J n=1 Tax=Actinoplanes sp. NPDC049681 TaxID=3363905 RepID=UPI0037898DEC